MPLVINGSDVFPIGFNAPNDGEDVDAASVIAGLGGLADRTKFLLQRMTGVETPGGAPAGFVAGGPTFFAVRVLNSLQVLGAAAITGGATAGAFYVNAGNVVDRRLPVCPIYDVDLWRVVSSALLIENTVGGTITPGATVQFPLFLPHESTLDSVSIEARVPVATVLPTSTLRVKFSIVSKAEGFAPSIVAGPYASTASTLAAYQALHVISGAPALTIDAEARSYWISVTADAYSTPQGTSLYLANSVQVNGISVRPGGF